MTAQDPERPLRRTDLIRPFTEGIKAPEDLNIGVEWEKIGVYRDTLRAIRYSGERGVEAILEALVCRRGWRAIRHEGHPIALEKDGASITLEPGGQIELSGLKKRYLRDNLRELESHLSEIKSVSDPLGIVWLGIGAQPFSGAEEIEWVPKERYRIMREALRGDGALTYSMMKETASTQVSLDYTSERDAVEKLRLALALAPALIALYANSPITGGRPSGYLSWRSRIWQETAPGRSGLIRSALENPRFGFEDYAEYALDVPMLFIIREGRWIPARGICFRLYLEKGLEGHRATAADWELHLSTLFTEARLKSYLEIRSADCQRTEIGISIPALIKGLFYDGRARDAAWALVEDLSWEERLRLRADAARLGLQASYRGRPLLVLAKTLIELAEGGLKRQYKPATAPEDETRYLGPIRRLIFQQGQCPAERLLACFLSESENRDRLQRLVPCAEIGSALVS